MLTDEYYDWALGRRTDFSLAKLIVYSIAHDLRDRRGIRQEWDMIDPDIQEEILQTLIDIVQRELTRG
jgi:hypothetical protein